MNGRIRGAAECSTGYERLRHRPPSHPLAPAGRPSRRGGPLPAHRGTMMAHPHLTSGGVRRFDGHEIDPDRQGGQRAPVRKPSRGHQAFQRGPEPAALAPIHRFLGKTESPLPPPAHFDEDQGDGRPRIDGDEVDLRSADMHVSP